ncbi:MAG: type 2 isopentenyl-diphosphate Delta-isomerase [Thermoprotei archaeon]|nr:MAG: type 2 isopentenyl-diphosphate Delta-isomerase [Thermoprotei archaeon]RLF02415.1 MAG: type 2 isopentenyl-diphosphate Delta-isomerase [Thermoprotei archaeon]
MKADDSLENRKLEHIQICSRENVEPKDLTAWFEDIYLLHDSLPESNLSDIDTTTSFLDHEFKAPIMVAGMTGGHVQTKEINVAIAEVVEELGIGMGVGSQRAALKSREAEETFSVVRKKAPTAFIVGNIGASQLVLGEIDLETIERLLEMIDANALAIHLNPLHESVQLEGEPVYAGLLEKIREIVESIKIPVILKETGCGFSKEAALKAITTGISAIDVGGAGGTSFALVEYYRALRKGEFYKARISETFSHWGIPTAVSICEVRSVTSLPLIATGGIRTGIHAAKAIALGANLVGIALPVLRAYVKGGVESIKEYLRSVIDELKIAMFLVGARRVKDLTQVPLVLSPRFLAWLQQRSIDLEKARKNISF